MTDDIQRILDTTLACAKVIELGSFRIMEYSFVTVMLSRRSDSLIDICITPPILLSDSDNLVLLDMSIWSRERYTVNAYLPGKWSGMLLDGWYELPAGFRGWSNTWIEG